MATVKILTDAEVEARPMVKAVFDDIRASGGIYLTPANFVAPPFGELGALARNAFHGPGVNNFDMGAIKNVAVGDRAHLQLRGEFFNTFNHPQFAIPDTNYTDLGSTFGVITGTSVNPRFIQFALKFSF